MSAFIVNPHHLDVMLSYFNRHDGYVTLRKKQIPDDALIEERWYTLRGSDIDELRTMKQILSDQNCRSINERYNEQKAPPIAEFHLVHRKFSPVDIIKACNCYEYQACETEDYQQTDAARISDAIRSTAIGNLAGYEEAAWEIREPVEV